MTELEDLKKQILALKQENKILNFENNRLKNLLPASEKEAQGNLHVKNDFYNNKDSNLNLNGSKEVVNQNSPNTIKIKLFRSLFRGREDVYPARWESQKGKSGYSPVCTNEWDRKFCKKPIIKCGDCDNKKYAAITDQTISDHLSGKITIGVYPMLQDENCFFLACDFDDKEARLNWQNDALAYLKTCKDMNIPAYLERSRSGKGGHIWIFFETKIPAFQARKLGFIILTKTMDNRYQIGLSSYDRFFPNQDTIPKGGLGNLIALPLQHRPRIDGNSVFINESAEPFPDQWDFLYRIIKISQSSINQIVSDNYRQAFSFGIQAHIEDEELEPWNITHSPALNEPLKCDDLPARINIVLSNMIFIDIRNLPSLLINRIRKLAAFQNPEFYRAQAMRLNTFGKPRIISSAEEYPNHIGIPRGCLDDLKELLKNNNIELIVEDKRCSGLPIEASFKGKLRQIQGKALKSILDHEIGILSAGTAFGKTVVGAALIAERKVNTLILVHRKQLMDQWKQRLLMFLELPDKSIGQIGGSKDKSTKIIDIAMLQTLNRKGKIKDIVSEYGLVIVDECHHISAFSFEQVMKTAKAKHVLGLTATPIRKDGHQPILFMQCGPIRFKIQNKDIADQKVLKHTVIPKYTDFSSSTGFFSNTNDKSIQDIYSELIQDQNRNQSILNDVIAALENKRIPLLLTERKEHVDYFEKELSPLVRNIIVLRAGMGKRKLEEKMNMLLNLSDDESRIIISTGKYIGEGFDNARLDTLFLAMPVSWRGTLEQYVGRLHRNHHSKKELIVYDYADINEPMLKRMFDKRLRGYKAIGYEVGE
ncbi:MAG: DEAD/DEAH box helicase family protein [Brevinematales bacterium]